MFKIALVFLSLIVLSHALGGIVGRGQKVTVVGKLTCNGAPAKDGKVKLYEDGTGKSNYEKQCKVFHCQSTTPKWTP